MKILDDIKADLTGIKDFMAKHFGAAGASAGGAKKESKKDSKDDEEDEDGERKDSCGHESLLAQSKSLLEAASGRLQTAVTDLTNFVTLKASVGAAETRLDQFMAAVKIAPTTGMTFEAKLNACLGSVTTTLAKQGVDVSQLPAASLDNGQPKETARAKYSRFLSENKPVEASRFYAANAEAILAGK